MMKRLLKLTIEVSALAFCITKGGAQIPDATAAPVPPPQALFPISTSPSNDDLNPYGVAFIPFTVPVTGTQGLTTAFNPGDILVSNFNNAMTASGGGNLQGTGTSIIRIQSNGLTSTFYQTPAVVSQQPGQPGVGFTNALVALQNGMVIVGNLPTTDGTFATVSAGSLLFIRRDGTLSTQISYQPNASGSAIAQTTKGYVTNSFFNADVIDGPWSMAVNDQGNAAQIFLSNVLTGTIVRFHVTFDSDGNGVVFDQYPVYVVTGLHHENDANGFLLGPSGLAYDPLPNSPTQDTLFIASSKDNAVYMLPGAAWNATSAPVQVLTVDAQHLHGPLGVALAPNGNLYVANSDGNNADPNQPSEIVIYDMNGNFKGQFSVDPQNGGAFGIAFQPLATINRPARNGSIEITTPVARFAAVNDNFAPGNPLSLFKTPVLNAWTLFFN
jgi:hypothetical protein